MINKSNTEAHGKCVAHKIFYEKDFTITKKLNGKDGIGSQGPTGPAGRSIIKTVDYYALAAEKPLAPQTTYPFAYDSANKSYSSEPCEEFTENGIT